VTEVPNDHLTDRTPDGGDTDEAAHGGSTAVHGQDFVARTAAVEERPLEDRADGFSALHDELRTRLESGGSASA
jgi:hypothetical protein